MSSLSAVKPAFYYVPLVMNPATLVSVLGTQMVYLSPTTVSFNIPYHSADKAFAQKVLQKYLTICFASDILRYAKAYTEQVNYFYSWSSNVRPLSYSVQSFLAICTVLSCTCKTCWYHAVNHCKLYHMECFSGQQIRAEISVSGGLHVAKLTVRK